MKAKVEQPKSNNANRSRFFLGKNESGLSLQAKLKVGEPNDKYEEEADRVADQVMKKSENESQTFFGPAQSPNSQNNTGSFIQEKPLAASITPLIQRQEEEEEAQPKLLGLTIQKQEEEEEEAQPKLLGSIIQKQEEEEEIMPKSNYEVRAKNNTEQDLKNTKGNGRQLNEETRLQMENSFGVDFSSVNIHTDNRAVQLNQELGAQAFTTGNDIYFNKGKYQPGTPDGRKLLAHELTHTVQQGIPVQPYIQREVTATTSPAEATAEAATCDESTQREKEAFINNGVYGPRSLSPTSTRTGGFEASYNPLSETLQITVRGKTRFENGLTVDGSGLVGSHESDLAQLARLLNYINDPVLTNTVVSNYYTWTEEQRNESTINFRNRISETIWIWADSSLLSFEINQPCWEDIQAFVDMNIDVQDAGTAAYSGASNASNDHLQVTLVKNPERSEFAAVRSLISTTAERIGNTRMESIDTAAGLTTGASVHSSRRGGGRNTNPFDSEMTLSNLSLQNTPSEVNDFNRSMLRRSVVFARNESELDSTDKARIDQFIIDFSESDTNASNSNVTLIGHASRLGSTRANRRLVAARLNSVMSYLREKGFTNISSRVQTENRSDTMAERYADTEGNAAAFRRVEIVVGTGELQNTVAHEFGHVFGLLDEYATVGTSLSGTGTAPGTRVGHSSMSESIGAGRVQSENSDNIMSAGNEVRAQHYGPFGWALNQLTGKNWRINS